MDTHTTCDRCGRSKCELKLLEDIKRHGSWQRVKYWFKEFGLE
jgi:hypothetical protein